MAHPRSLKLRAMELWATGDRTLEQLAKELGVPVRTIDRWKQKSQPNRPVD